VPNAEKVSVTDPLTLARMSHEHAALGA